jgi:hypothetical protein
VASAVSGENGRDGGQRELPQLINLSLLLKWLGLWREQLCAPAGAVWCMCL